MRITLDTNVLISSWIVPDGSADQVMQLVRQGDVELVLSPFILDELTRILTQKFNLPPSSVEKAVRRIERLSTIVQPEVTINIIKEKQDDNRILECAVSGKVDYLITGDKKHILPLGSIQGISIITITEFLRLHRSPPE
jgi:putative PIN family toxin of toxin-antitoxin system